MWNEVTALFLVVSFAGIFVSALMVASKTKARLNALTHQQRNALKATTTWRPIVAILLVISLGNLANYVIPGNYANISFAIFVLLLIGSVRWLSQSTRQNAIRAGVPSEHFVQTRWDRAFRLFSIVFATFAVARGVFSAIES